MRERLLTAYRLAYDAELMSIAVGVWWVMALWCSPSLFSRAAAWSVMAAWPQEMWAALALAVVLIQAWGLMGSMAARRRGTLVAVGWWFGVAALIWLGSPWGTGSGTYGLLSLLQARTFVRLRAWGGHG